MFLQVGIFYDLLLRGVVTQQQSQQLDDDDEP